MTTEAKGQRDARKGPRAKESEKPLESEEGKAMAFPLKSLNGI